MTIKPNYLYEIPFAVALVPLQSEDIQLMIAGPWQTQINPTNPKSKA
jgi:hypothetical protein